MSKETVNWQELEPDVLAPVVIPRLPANQSLPISGSSLTLEWVDTTNLAASGVGAWSDWRDIACQDVLVIGRTLGAGGYALDIEWSQDGQAGDLVETVTVANNTTVSKPVALPFARFRVRNTSAVAAQTAHRTNVFSQRGSQT